MTLHSPASFASALLAAAIVLATWSSTLTLPSAHPSRAMAAAASAPAAHIILA